MAHPVPDDFAGPVQVLDVRPDDRLLELGCGPGVAVSLVCDHLTQPDHHRHQPVDEYTIYRSLGDVRPAADVIDLVPAARR